MSERMIDAPQIVVAYLAAALVFLALDFVWLSNMTAAIYRPRIGDLLLEQPKLAYAAIFYLFYAAGIVYFAVLPGLNADSWKLALLNGVILGGLAYGTYDVTNFATLKGWSGTVSVIDVLWGCCVTGLSATGSWAAVRIFRSCMAG